MQEVCVRAHVHITTHTASESDSEGQTRGKLRPAGMVTGQLAFETQSHGVCGSVSSFHRVLGKNGSLTRESEGMKIYTRGLFPVCKRTPSLCSPALLIRYICLTLLFCLSFLSFIERLKNLHATICTSTTIKFSV